MSPTGMKVSNSRLNSIFLRVAVFWSVLVVSLAGWGYWEFYTSVFLNALSAAQESYKKDVIYRRWATRHGGVYAPITSETPPNPYLSGIPERDISTPSGTKLTLINPAYMNRQVYEMGVKEYGVHSHITSLKPIRPENAPDEWERKALQAFERGQQEVSSLELLGEATYFRLMHPLVTEAGCLKCHAVNSHKVGDILGGISVSVPWAPYRKSLWAQMRVTILAHGMIWMIGILGLYFGKNRFLNYLSAREQAEEAMKILSSREEAILAAVPDIIMEVDNNKVYTWANSAGIEFFGEDVIGKEAAFYFEGEQDTYEKVSPVFRGSEDIIYVESWQRHRNEEKRLLAWWCRALRDENGQVTGALSSARDITERKKADEALRTSNELFSLFMRHSPIYTYIKEVTPTQSIVLQASDNFAQMIGIPGSKMVGKTMAELFPPEFAAKITAEDWAVDSRGDVLRLEEELNDRSYSTIKFPIVRGDKTLLAGYTIDITERKQAEEENRSLQERLQRSEKMEALGTLAGGVAHDLNNVLGVVVGYSELVLDGVDKSSPIRRNLENIMNGGLKAAAIVDDLLTLARRGVQGRSNLNLNKIVADCQKSPEFANLTSYHPSVTIKTDLETDLLSISGSSVHLGKSLYNLISNASEAMPKGGTVIIKTTNQYLDKPIQGYDRVQEGDYVVLSVSDTGHGIPEADLKRIFEPFYTKKVMGRSGTGLGLSVVWGTVKDHNGYINVQSEEGKGSTFTLYFPVTRADIAAEVDALATSEYMGKGESILVVDDAKEQRDLAASILKTLNYSVSAVSSGEEAVAYLKEHEIDLMLLDMIMDPGIDGLDTYKQVLEIRPKQKAIIVSGYSESERVRAARKLGAGAYVRKPYIKGKLGLAVRKELDRFV